MQAVPPPPPVECIEAVDAANTNIKAFMVAAGDPAQLGEWLTETRNSGRWKVEADAESNGVRFVRLIGDGGLPYRDIGGAIYAGQSRQLSINFYLEPPLCEVEEN